MHDLTPEQAAYLAARYAAANAAGHQAAPIAEGRADTFGSHAGGLLSPPQPDRTPTVYAPACRYCVRYRRACGRHDGADQ